ncbi:MAG: YebC/PmpR family DNA-binding transcriptional regulator [Patescibacteria group bacterium]
MSGHNKWSKVKHKKAASDAQKSKQFSKLSKLITTEVKKAGGDRESAGVKKAIEQAKSVNMPNDAIERAVNKAQQTGADSMETVVYETYGPEGVAIIIEGITDNRNRTSSEIKSTLSKHGMEMAQPGSAAWAFEKKENSYEVITSIEISEKGKEKLSTVINDLEDNEDVQATYNNAS